MRDLRRRQPQAARIGDAQRLAAAHDGHGFEALVAHHGTAAVLARHVPIIAVDGGKAHLVFSGNAAGVHAELVAGQVERLLQGLLRLPGILAEEGTGVA